MLQKSKRKLFGVILSVVMIVSVMAVFAGYRSGAMGSGDSSASIELTCLSDWASAATTPTSSGARCYTSVTISGVGSYSSSGSRSASVSYGHSGSCDYASSYHECGYFYKTLSVAP